MKEALVIAKNVKKYYPAGKSVNNIHRYVKAVDDVSITINHDEFVGVVGESGCGKSTLGRCLLKLTDPSEGNLIFEGNDYTHFEFNQMLSMRKKMQMIFQNPFSSFNPKMTMYSSLAEVGRYYKMPESELEGRIEQLVEYINLDESILHRHPSELSGGQLQRLAIARALILEPSFIVADEPVSALDVSVQAQVLNIILDLREREHMAMLFISHDLTVVEHVCDEIVVMYLGAVVERGKTRDVIDHPAHPYTKALLASKPRMDPSDPPITLPLSGDIPNAIDMPEGCRFWTRCPYANKCSREQPVMKEVAPGHWSACFL